MSSTQPVRKVVIVGRDAGAWLTALTLQRSFGRQGANGRQIEIELLELPPAVQPQDVYVTLPGQQAFHRLLGLDETRLLRAASGLYALGQRFANWSGADKAFLHAYDTHGTSLGKVEFFQLWLKARAQGLQVPLEEFSLGAAAASQGRFVIFNDKTQAFSHASHGYHLDAIAYLAAIGKVALKAGLRHSVGEVAVTEVRDGRIVGLQLRDGRRIEGDLFVDGSGAEACLIRHLEPAGNFESWRAWLPCDRLMVASAAVLQPVPAFSQLAAFYAGWVGSFPLMNRTALVAAYSSEASSDAQVLEMLPVVSGLRPVGEVVTSSFRPGARRQQWLGNCVALGEAAVALDPLDGLSLHPLLTGLSWLVSLFPVSRESMPEASVYNAKLASHAIGLRDFQAAHFKLNRRFGEAFWDAARAAEPSPTLAQKLRLFEARGVIAMQEDETFQEENWTAIFTGHRLQPRSWDPLVERIPEQETMQNFQRMLRFIAAETQAMPSLQAQLEMNAPQAPLSEYGF